MSALRGHPWLALAAAGSLAAGLTALASTVPAFQSLFGQLPTLIGPFAGWVALFPNEAKKLASEFAGRTLYWTHGGERLAVAAGIEADFAIASSELNDEAPGAVTRAARIQWMRGAEKDPELVEGQVVVRLHDHRHRARNLVSFALAQAGLGSLSLVRAHLDRDVSRAADFALARRMLERIDRNAAHDLIRDVCLPECRTSERLARLVEQTQAIDERGLFTRIAVREFVELGQRQGLGLPSADAAEESVQFVEYLHRIASKAPQEQLDEKLGFNGRFLRVGVVLVARPDVVALHGNAAYTKRVGEYVKAGVPVVYLAARGSNVAFAKQVVQALHEHGNVATVEEFEYETVHNGVTRPTFLARVTVNIRLSRKAERRFLSLREEPKRQAS